MKAKLILIPNLIDDNVTEVIPEYVKNICFGLNHFIVENIKEARRYLRKIGYTKNFDDVIFFEWNKHDTSLNMIDDWLAPIKKNLSVGLISDAGCPAVADPGADVVRRAHEFGIEVSPLVGPSSILLALMASGMNGQSFAFNGYLSQDKNERDKEIKKLEAESKIKNQTQIFIETPYRNNQLLEDFKSILSGNTLLCVAANLSSDKEIIITKKISEWKKIKYDFHKQMAIFLFLSQ